MNENINEYKITSLYNNITVKDYMRRVLGLSARALKSIKYHGSIKVDGKAVFVDFQLKENMILSVEYPQSASSSICPEDIALDIIYEDDDMLVVNKPHNMPSIPSKNHHSNTLANGVMYKYRNTPFVYRVLTRLDIDTTGVVIIAKNQMFAGAFQKCKINKEYLAVCVNSPDTDEGTIDAPIGRADGIIKRCVTPLGKPSVTHYKVLSKKDNLCLIKAMPITGRTHQIRVHLSHIGCPLYSDFLYGTEITGARTMLHCRRVSFIHPKTKEIITFTAPLPQDFLQLNFDNYGE